VIYLTVPQSTMGATSSCSTTVLSKTTKWRRERAQQQEADGQEVERKRKKPHRQRAYNICKKCGEPKTIETGHSQ
jgi:formylmethanofuran dehydrogenase subunit E